MKTEKRRDPRYQCFVPVDCKEGTLFACSQTTNISASGAGFVSSQFIPVDTKMMVELNFTPDGQPAMAIGKVEWIRPMPEVGGYRLGLSFADIS